MIVAPPESEYQELGVEVAQMGGKACGKLAWLYADLAGGRNRGEANRLFEKWMSKAPWPRSEGVDTRDWIRWVEERIGVVSDRVESSSVSLTVGVGADKELRGLQRVYRWLSSTVADWGTIDDSGRQRHSTRCLARARVFALAAELRSRYAEEGELRSLDRTLCKRAAGAYYRLSQEWVEADVTRSGMREWFRETLASALPPRERVAARDWSWATDAAEAVDLIENLATRAGGMSEILLSNEAAMLKQCSTAWERGQ